jgi:TIR domain/SIR2-like domain
VSNNNSPNQKTILEELHDLDDKFGMIMTNDEKRMNLEEFFKYVYEIIQNQKFQRILSYNRSQEVASNLSRISTTLNRLRDARNVQDLNEAAVQENGAKNGIIDLLSQLRYAGELDSAKNLKDEPVSAEEKIETSPEKSFASTGIEPSTNRPVRVFISYTKEDTRTANKLYNDLKMAGVYPWLDSESLLPGQNWKVATKLAIKNSRYFITVISKNSEREGRVQRETKEALEILKEFRPSEIFVIPIRIENCTVSDEKLNELYMIDMYPDWELGIQRILKSMGAGSSQNSMLQDASHSELDDSTWTELLRYIIEGKCNTFVGPEAHVRWIPTDEHLAVKWSGTFGYPFQDSFRLPVVAQFLAIRNQNRDPMYPKKLLSKILQQIKTPDFALPEYENSVYAILADLNLPIYLTTNYDHFMEAALKNKGKDPVSEFCRWNHDIEQYAKRSGIDSLFDVKNYKPKISSPLVYHLHGDMDEPISMVLTETDYLEFFMNMGTENGNHILPRLIQQTLVNSSQLFIGYSLQDLISRILFGSIARFWASVAPPMALGVISPDMIAGDNYSAAKNYLDGYAKDILKLQIYWSDPFIFSNQLRNRLNEFKKNISY